MYFLHLIFLLPSYYSGTVDLAISYLGLVQAFSGDYVLAKSTLDVPLQTD